MALYEQKCKGRVKTDSSMSMIVPINMDHTHDRNDKKECMQQLRIQVKCKATDDLTSRPSKIIRNELHKFAYQLSESSAV